MKRYAAVFALGFFAFRALGAWLTDYLGEPRQWEGPPGDGLTHGSEALVSEMETYLSPEEAAVHETRRRRR